MDYDARLEAIGKEINTILGTISQPLGRLNFLQGQMEILSQMKAEDEAAKKAALEKLKESEQKPPVEETSQA